MTAKKAEQPASIWQGLLAPSPYPRNYPTLAEELASGNPWLRYERLKRQFVEEHPDVSCSEYEQEMTQIAARVIPLEEEF